MSTYRKLDAALADASCEAEVINILADSIVGEFQSRYNIAGCSIEQAAVVDQPYASPAAYRLARAKLTSWIEVNWGRDAADRWDARLRPIWG